MGVQGYRGSGMRVQGTRVGLFKANGIDVHCGLLIRPEGVHKHGVQRAGHPAEGETLGEE